MEFKTVGARAAVKQTRMTKGMRKKIAKSLNELNVFPFKSPNVAPVTCFINALVLITFGNAIVWVSYGFLLLDSNGWPKRSMYFYFFEYIFLFHY